MDILQNIIELTTSLVYYIAIYLVVDVIMAHYFTHVSLKFKAKMNLDVSRIVAGTCVGLANTEVMKFNTEFKRAGEFGNADVRRQRILTNLGLATSSASARHALFSSMHLHDPETVKDYEESLEAIMDVVKEIYIKVEDLTPEDAEQRLIDGSMFAIADLDMRGEIMDGYSLQNPAELHFRKISIPGKSNQS